MRFDRTRTLAALIMAIGVYPTVARSQATTSAATSSDAGVFTQIVAKLDQDRGEPFPVSGLRIYVVSESGERETLITNRMGVAMVWLPAAAYRIVTPEPVMWGGEALTWDFMTDVHKGIAPIQLFLGNTQSSSAITATNSTVRLPDPMKDPPRTLSKREESPPTVVSAGRSPTPSLQAPVVWAKGAENADQFFRNGEVVRILVYDGIAVSASAIRTDELMWVNVSVTNRSDRRIDVDPATFSLKELNPKERTLAFRDPRDLAKSITRRGQWGAALTLLAGDLSKAETTTEVNSSGSATTTGRSRINGTARNVYTGEQVQVSATTSGRSTTTTRNHTTIRTTGPDEAARENAAIQAEGITARAGMKADKVLAQALLANTVQPGADISGAVFFERDKKAKELRFRLHIGTSVFEIPLEIR